MFVVATGLALGSGVGSTQAAVRPAAAFAITSITPNPASVTVNATPEPVQIAWSGTPVFPVTARLVPTKNCAPAGYTCTKAKTRFKTNANPLVWTDLASCSGTLSDNSVRLRFKLVLVDAAHVKTHKVVWVLVCHK